MRPEHLIEIEPRPGERTLRTEDVIRAHRAEGSQPGPGSAARRAVSHRTMPGPAAADRRGAPCRRRGRSWTSLTPSATRRCSCTTGMPTSPCGAATSISMPVPARSAAASCMSGMRAASICRGLPAGGDTIRRRGFEMGPEFNPIAGAQGWQISNPPVLSTAPLLASLEIFQRAGIATAAREIHCTDRILAASHRERLLPGQVEIVTPRVRGRARLPIEPANRRGRPPPPGAATNGSRRPAWWQIGASPTFCAWRRFRSTIHTGMCSPRSNALSAGRASVSVDRRAVRIVGAGPTGALLAILLQRRGLRRGDCMRAAPTRDRTAGRIRAAPSIWRWPIAASTPCKAAGVFAGVRDALLPMRGRLIHHLEGRHVAATLRAAAQRGDLFDLAAAAQPDPARVAAAAAGVTVHFEHRFEAADFDAGTAQIRDLRRDRLISVPMQPLLATDGAGSWMRRRMSALQ